MALSVEDDGRVRGAPLQKVAIVGCGLIGQAWAVVFLRSGFRVALFDADHATAERAWSGVVDRLKELAAHGLLNRSRIEEFAANLAVEGSLEAALEDAAYVQENGPEDLGIKSALTAELDRHASPDVPIGSSTSGIPASQYSVDVPGRHRCLVVHPINPPHLVPAVEIVPSPWTSAEVTARVSDLMKATHQTPIHLDKEIDGFVVNRLQGALLSEAFRLLGQGVASAEDIDKAVSDGLGLRWSIIGPFETIHLNAPGGVAQYVQRYGPMYRQMFQHDIPSEDWSVALEDGLERRLCARHPVSNLGQSQADRDSALMALLAHRLAPRNT